MVFSLYMVKNTQFSVPFPFCILFSGEGRCTELCRPIFVLSPLVRPSGREDNVMKINWNFATGEVSEVEVSEGIGAVIFESRRVEDNLDRNERYHCYSYDAVDFEGKEYGSIDYYECLDSTIEENTRIHNAFGKLTKIQQRRLLMLAKGLSIREIARLENADFKSIYESIKAARKKFHKNF